MAHIYQPKLIWKIRGPAPVPNAQWFSCGNCNVFIAKEPTGWHLSISTPTRNPTWEEIREARYRLIPHDVTMAMILPPPSEYVNLHQFCFHLYQIPNDPNMVSL